MSESADSNDANASPEVAQVKAAKAQPKGLWVLFITEMWERFSYYGMRALLVLYLTSKLSASNPGFGWTEDGAQRLFGLFAGLVYLTPLLGGWLADKVLGTHRSILIGGWIMAAGQGFLFLTEYWGHNPEWGAIWWDTALGPFLTFIVGLILIIIGTGFFKPCVSVMVGQLYGADDPRRDSGFTIFYMGINVGAFMATTFAGLIGEAFGWYWGFGAAAVGMVCGLTVYQLVRPFFLKGIGLPPHHQPEHEEGHEPTPEEIKQAEIDEYERTRPLTRVDWDRMFVIIILSVLAIVFWVAFEQAATSLNLFAQNRTNRHVMGFEIPTTWFLSINPAAIVLLAPLFAGLWGWLDKRGLQPPTPVKFGLGLALLSLAYVPMVFGSLEAGSPKPIELADAPEAVQKVLDPVLERLDKERKEDEAKEKAKHPEQEEEETSGPSFLEKVLDFVGLGSKKEEETKFDLIEELTYEGVNYYAVGYADRKAAVYELLNAQGELLRRRAIRKENQDDGKLEKVKDAEPQPIKLEDVPEAARKTILAQRGNEQVESVRGKVVAREPVITVWTEKDGREYEKTHHRRIRDFTATWETDDGEVTLTVAEDGLLLGKETGQFREVGLAGPQWLLLMYLLATCGELCLSPISLSMVTKLSPARYTAAMMGLFFVTFAIANFIAGNFAAYSDDIASGKWFSLWGGQVDFFIVLFIAPLVISIVVFLISPVIKRMMHGLH